MNNLTKCLIVEYLSNRVLRLLTYFAMGLLLFGGVSYVSYSKEPESVPTLTEEFSSIIYANKPKSVFVFMDGTANNPKIPTNIYRTYKEVQAKADSSLKCNFCK